MTVVSAVMSISNSQVVGEVLTEPAGKSWVAPLTSTVTLRVISSVLPVFEATTVSLPDEGAENEKQRLVAVPLPPA